MAVQLQLFGNEFLDRREWRRRAGLSKASLDEYTVVIKQDGDWWIGWIEEVPGANCQEFSRDELLETLKITLQEAFELNR